MKPKNPTWVIVALVIAIFGIGFWLYPRPAPLQVKTSVLTTPPTVSKYVAPPTIAAPIIPPAPKPVTAPIADTPPVANPAPDSADPQADLKTAIPDIARLLRAGDTVGFRQTYTPPDELAQLGPQYIQQLQARVQQRQAQAAQDPDLQQELQKINEGAAEAWEAIEDQTPTFNAAGDEATYQYMLPGVGDAPGAQVPRVFVKIDGKWYLK
jgi:hypothetical protein